MVTAPTPPAPFGRSRPRSIVAPLVLIGLGLLFLGQNFGYVSDDVWQGIWRLWPLLLVVAGVEMIFGRGGVGNAIAAIVLVATIAFFAFTVLAVRDGTPWLFGSWGPNLAAPFGIERVSEELGETTAATIDLSHGAGRLSIAALAADSGKLFEGDLAYGERMTIDRRVVRQASETRVRLAPRGDRIEWRGFRNLGGSRLDWNVALAPRVATTLLVHSGASEVSLDLRELNVTRLELDTGASAVRITTPQAAEMTTARVKAGAANVEITVPEGVAARIRVRQGISSVDVDQARFPRLGDYYQSPDFDTAANKIDINAETGVSNLRIR